jgi:D-sedoheptulose 7-phosphate isomerase
MNEFSSRLMDVMSCFDQLRKSEIEAKIKAACKLIVSSLSANKPLLVCGNGGSAADAQHISAELVGRFLLERRALNVICLSSNTAIITAWGNDYDYDSIFARQVEAHGYNCGVLMCLSTSGNSINVIKALKVAKHLGMDTIGMTGQGGGNMSSLCDILIDVPSKVTPRIQEMHLVIYHFLCEQIELALVNKVT